MDALIDAVFARQDHVITRKQALRYLTQDEVASRLGRHWRVVLPGIYASSPGPPSRQQRLRAALLHAGPTAMLNDTSALAAYRIPFLPSEDLVRVLVADSVQRVSRDFVVVRRTTRLPAANRIDGLPTVPAYRAVCEFVARHDDQRDGLAVAAAAVQLGRVSMSDLKAEMCAAPARGKPRLLRVAEMLQAGVRSAPESDFRSLVLRSRGLGEPLWNCLLLLPNGAKISPDALWTGSRLIHEVNGRRYHAAEDAGHEAFEDMQRRSDLLVAAGFTVLHNTPNRIRNEPRAVMAEVRTCHARGSGLGLPPGVVVLRAGPPGAAPCDVTLHGA